MESAKIARVNREWAANIPKGWGTFGDANMHSGERKLLYDLIRDDEHIIAMVGGSFGPDLKQYNPLKREATMMHRGCVVATTERLLFLDKGMLWHTETHDLDYQNIESIRHSTGRIYGGVGIVARGTSNMNIETVRPKKAAKHFSEKVRERIIELRNKAVVVKGVEPPQPDSTLTQQLESLWNLHQQGALSKDDFERAKDRLLSSNSQN